MKSRTLRLLPGVVAAVALVPARAHAFVQAEASWSTRSFPVPYRINLASIPASLGATAGQSAVDQGFASWMAPACTSWRATNAGTSTLARPVQGDRQSTIVWISADWPAEYSTQAIGVTVPQWLQGGSVQEADMWFNDVDFQWGTTGARNTVDAQSIATHEEGHFLGLNHSSIMSAVMYASYSGGLKRTLTADDSAGVCTIYPSGAAIPPDTTDAGTVVTPTPGSGLGESCDNTDCDATLQCGCFSANQTNCYCTRQCSTASPCTGATTCINTQSGHYCIPNALVPPSTQPADAGDTTTVDPAPTPGQVGDECSGPEGCAAAICLHASSPSRNFCSRACASDCDCPSTFQCVAVSSGSYCVPGAGSCEPGTATGEADAGTTTTSPVGTADASTTSPGTMPATPSGCGCAVPGAPGPRGSTTAVLTLAALGAVFARRRRAV